LPSEDSGVHWDSNSQSGSSLGSVGVHSLTLSYTFGNMTCDSQATFLARTFVSPCFDHEPKARVATKYFKEEQVSSPWMERLKVVLESVMSYNVVLTKVRRKKSIRMNMLFGMKRHFS